MTDKIVIAYGDDFHAVRGFESWQDAVRWKEQSADGDFMGLREIPFEETDD